ncbi:MAG: ABC transporter ATP-binding protein [Desulfobacterales bacterium]|jgi:branched-chain amino acid transport system ATP-binding protein|nr:ABC transporter ATP-binding protein [Desulfobacterales bacterium]
MAALLEVEQIDLFRGETQVLWGVSLALAPGERVAVLGSNGAGKSSLLAAVTAAIPPAAGAIRFDGRSLAGKRPHDVTGLGIALVPEGRRVYKDMSVRENLEMGAFPKRARGRLKQTLEHVIQLFPILGQRRDQPAGTLSGGEQQMLAIGRALMSRPRLLLVDELSLGLAPMITKSIYRTLSELGSDITILLVEQNVEQALNVSRRAFILENGRITRSGRSSDLLQDADIRRAYLGL